ncbi:ATP-grasp domain-containing protein [Parahaliea mediterranea]|uniref:ATP-grasp domain-containing protein n=1 Tax=Parahaliea mediterranea TaxID=651086 RepID=UPI000E2F6F59|nr:ATP-grasp domain-containing protein [Parahaliea mediterranea]
MKNSFPRRVLVFPDTTEIACEIFSSLRDAKEIDLYGASANNENISPLRAEKHAYVEPVTNPVWVDQINALCSKWDIDYIYPAHDDVILALAKQRKFMASIPLIPSTWCCEITRSKTRTYKELEGLVRVPKVHPLTTEEIEYPVFIKPDCGNGSIDAQRIDSLQQYEAAIEKRSDLIVCEYLPGPEFTVDCFSDRDHGLLYCGARERLHIKNGISVITRTLQLPNADAMARAISSKLGMQGAWFFQIKRAKSGELTLLEVAPRIAGSMACNRIRGVNFPLLTIFEHERLPISISPIEKNAILYRRLSFHSKIEDQELPQKIYVDYDDTLVIADRINIRLVGLLLHLSERGAEIHLISKHKGQLLSDIKKRRLLSLFDSIVHITDGRRKSDYIDKNSANAIFIDDSYSERREIESICKIQTFDCSMIESLFSLE